MSKPKQHSGGMSDYFIKLVLTMVSVIIILAVLLTGLLFHDFRTVSARATEEQELSAVRRSAHSVEEMSSIAGLIYQQLRANPAVTSMLLGEGAGGTVTFFLPEEGSSSAAFIHSIYFINRTRDLSFVYRGGTLSEMPASVATELSKLALPAPGESAGPVITSYQDASGQAAQNITYLYGEAEGTIVINVSPVWLSEKIGAYQEGESRTFTVSTDGTRLDNTSANQADDGFITTVLATEKEQNILLLREGGAKYYVSYVKTPAITYIRVRPYAATQVWNYRFSSIALFFFVLILFGGFFLAVLLSRRLSRPVHHMADKIERLENRNNVSQRALKQEYLSNLLVASHISTREIGMRFADCKINISDHAPIFMILIKMDHWRDLCMKYNHADRSLLKYGLMNIAEELVSERFVCDLVDDADDSVVILCNYPSPAPKKEDISAVFRALNEALTTHLSFSVTTCVGYMIPDITHVAKLYDDLKKTAAYRMFAGHESIIYTSEIPETPAEEYNYPTAKEKQLIDSMMLGKSEKCIEIWEEFKEGILAYPPAVAQKTFSRLSLAVNTAFSGDAVHTEYAAESERLLTLVQNAETLSEIEEWYRAFFLRLAESKSDQRSKKYDDLIARIHERIETDFADPNLSVNSIAESEHRSPVYLGRLYKSRTGHSISEYINEIRIKEAKRLLSETNLTVNEIVERIGFSGSSYFYTVFKKHQGIAPNDYRQKQKQKRQDAESE